LLGNGSMTGWESLHETLWGHGEDLAALPMAVRAGCMFFLLLAQIRLAGARSFGRKSSFDNVVVIMLGAIAARGVVGASPFWSTVAACAVIVVVHRVLGRLCVTVGWLAKLLEGDRVALYVEGRLLAGNLKRTSISESDLLESHRLETQRAGLAPGEEAFMERNGRISFVKTGDA
jgi:uncharacterized membrane protein YcaP (DUF421 family)